MDFFEPLEAKVKHKKFLVLDIESKDGRSRTKPGFTRPFLVGIYDGNSYFEFRDLYPKKGRWQSRWHHPTGCLGRAMTFLLTERYKHHHIYAHYGGRFDFLFIPTWLVHEGEGLGYSFNIVPIASAIQILDITKKTGKRTSRWRFLDSHRLMPMSLDKAAKSFNQPGKLAHDLGLHEKDPSWSSYLRQDCIELYNVVSKFHDYIENTLNGEVGVTAPATSMKIFRRKHLKGSLPRSLDSHSFVRQGYFGGRVEVFNGSGTGLRYYDINSSYPRAMLEDMPIGEAQRFEGEPPAWLKRNIGFVSAKVHVPEDVILPPLPIRCNSEEPHVRHLKGRLTFPVGKLSGVWEYSELEKAVELGCRIEEWGASYWFERQKLFESFVTELYQYRDKTSPLYDEGLAAVCKIMMNSLYGKFGMKTIRKRIYRYDDPKLPSNAVPAVPSPDCPIYYADEESDACYVMPHISARVTALARIRLLDFAIQAIQKGGKLYYMDTDSLITNVVMPTSSVLGDLKDEYPEQSGKITGRFLGPKLYILQEVTSDFELVKAKGFEERTVTMIESLLSGETIYQRRLEKIGALSRRGFLEGPRMRLVPRRLLADKGKREMLLDGSTRPWKVNMW